jgi:hypothetical protein
MSWELLLVNYVFGLVLRQILLLVAISVEPLGENLVKVETISVEPLGENLVKVEAIKKPEVSKAPDEVNEADVSDEDISSLMS